MTPELARSLLDIIVDQLQRLEARAGRRAVRVSVSVPPHLDPGHARDVLADALSDRDGTLDIEVIPAGGRPRLLTVDFDLLGEAS